MMPLARPAVVTTAIFSFIWTWNDFFSQLIYLNSPDNYTVPIGLRLFVGGEGQTELGPMFAMSVLSLRAGVPVLPRLPATAGRGHQHRRAQGMTTPSLAEPVTERPDWRDSLSTAADLALSAS